MSASGSRDALTGLRFLAALHVVVFHFGGVWFENLPGALQALSACGYASVGLFYVLSGFVLAYNYLTPEGGVKAEPRSFWAARLARVYPVYALALVLLAPTVIQGSLEANTVPVAAAKLLLGGLSALLLVHAWLPPVALYWNPPGWSVSVEAFFYAVFPFAAPWLGRLRRGQLWGAMGGFWLLGLLPSLVYLGLQVDGGLNVLKFNPLLRLPEFLMGLVLGRLFLGESPSPRHSGALLAPAAAVLLLGAFAMSPSIPFVLLHNALLAPAFAALVYGLARGGGALGWVLSRPLLLRLGEASYALYILQYPVWKASQALAEAVAPWVDFRAPKPLFAVYLGLLVGLSWLTYRWFEMPMRAWGRKHLQGWVARGAPQTPSASPGTP
ncbi:acyltransferase family protein [Stigmatella erecta]|uniref:Peptidoglycan/LPS O-acetylase OafA/YrhL, contains acyltransferase and SGNH-hydrolase domains n=1 Tax=Stigmatella erecta TaxID=83460 RepID=A0A1I0KEZ1_9BACT|nr:acyltransferase [Stigmatella erecta]SEU22304.1 Peptidoglycan/LPS O-acetylase OafA/YrhL, contains acyltransferase and SGNH-hydrolase domains [Stigmatella erecta]